MAPISMDPTRSVAKPDQMRQLMKMDPNVVVMYSNKFSNALRKTLAGKRVTFYGQMTPP